MRSLCSVVIDKEIPMKFGKRDDMLFVVERFVHKRCKGFWRFLVDEKLTILELT